MFTLNPPFKNVDFNDPDDALKKTETMNLKINVITLKLKLIHYMVEYMQCIV